MYNIMQQLTDDCLIGNFVYELCLSDIWIIPFISISKWSDTNNLNIAYSDIQYFADSCNFKLITVDDEDAFDIPRGVGDFSSIEYLRRKYRIGLPKDVVEQLHQSVSEYLAEIRTHYFSSTTPMNIFTEPQLELYSVVCKIDTGVDYIHREYLVNTTSLKRALELVMEYFKNTSHSDEAIVGDPVVHILRKEGIIDSHQVGCY